MRYLTKKGKEISPVFDISPKMSRFFYTREKIRKELGILKDLGHSRVYFVLSNPGQPMFSSPVIAPVDNEDYFLARSDAELGGRPNMAFAQECKALGMEAIGILKPYECGGGMSVPEGVIVPEGGYHHATVGGNRMFYDKFINKNPDLRVIRKPDLEDAEFSMPITRIELAFALEPVEEPFRNGRRTRSEGAAGVDKSPSVNLWVSRDNGKYELYSGELKYRYYNEPREIKDANGYPVAAEKKNCRILEITGISLPAEYKYFAVTLENTAGLLTLPYSMIDIFSADRRLASTASVYVRAMNSHAEPVQWGAQKLPVCGFTLKGVAAEGGEPRAQLRDEKQPDAQYFNKYGFEFNWYGTGHHGDGWISSGVYGIARGKAKVLPGTICEAYPEVREYWLGQIKDALDSGFDGVDIRLQSHSSMICDPVNYGYNEPIVKRYKEIYGVDILKEEADPVKIMQVRGGFFMQFVEEAAKLIHDRKKSFQMHLKGAHEEPVVSNNWNMLCHWTMPKIALDWKRCAELVDEIVIKDYYFKEYLPEKGGLIKDYAKEHGKKLWIHLYVRQGDEFDRGLIEAVESDPRVTGILIYEMYYEEEFLKDLKSLYSDIGYAER